MHDVLTRSHLALALSMDTLRALYDEAELDVATQVDVREFVVLLCLCVLLEEGSSEERSAAAKEVKDLDRALNTLVEAFRYFDTDDKGWVTQADVGDVLGAHNDDAGHSTHNDSRLSPGGAAPKQEEGGGKRTSFERLKSLTSFSFGSSRIRVPDAFKTGEAVYSSWSLGLLHRVTGDFIWWETAIFDLGRDQGGDVLWHDTITGDVIVHSVLGAPSAFHTAAFDSAPASSAVWARKRLLHFTVVADQVRAGILQANAAFNITLGEDPADWVLVHTNLELEATGGARAGHSLAAMRVMLLED